MVDRRGKKKTSGKILSGSASQKLFYSSAKEKRPPRPFAQGKSKQIDFKRSQAPQATSEASSEDYRVREPDELADALLDSDSDERIED